MRDAEGLSYRSCIEQSKTTGGRDHRLLCKFPRIARTGCSFEPTNKYACRIGGVQTLLRGDNSVRNCSSLIHEVESAPIGKKQFESLMGVERKNVRFGSTHPLEWACCAAMQSSVCSMRSSVLQCDR